MEPLIALLAILVVGSSIWVGIDAWSIGARKGLQPGLVDLGPVGWALACLGLWVLAFPLYLANRGDILKAAKKSQGEHYQPTGGSAPALGSPGAQTPYRPSAGTLAPEQLGSGPRYKVRLAAGEFGPFALERLQEFVGTGQIKPNTIVQPDFGEVIAAEDVPGLRFPPEALAAFTAADRPPDAQQEIAHPTPSPSPRPDSLPTPSRYSHGDVSLAGNPSTLPVTAAHAAGEPPHGPHRESPGPDRAAAPLTGPSDPPSAAATSPSGGFPPSPFRTPDRASTGASAGVLLLLVLIAGLQVLSMVLRHTVHGPKDRWEHKVSSASDLKFDSHFDELGKEGWEIVTCRRAITGSASAREYRYECVLKRRAASESD